jgi:hypothetical protein
VKWISLGLVVELTEIEHDYSETVAILGTQDLSAAAFGAAPEIYNTVLNVTDNIKSNNLDIDDLEKVVYTMWHQAGGKPIHGNTDNELVLAVCTGTCYVCKNQGHTATNDCPSKSKGGGGNGGNKGYVWKAKRRQE